jgi:hypothetical protein
MKCGEIRLEKFGSNLFIDSAEKPRNASTRLSMNGKSPTISTAPPFVLRPSKDERRFFSRIFIQDIHPTLINFNVKSKLQS